MPEINLLPWRHELREAHKRLFFAGMAVALIVGLLLVFIAHVNVSRKLEQQKARNTLIKKEMAAAKVDTLEKMMKKRLLLLTQLKTIQQLENDRFLIVRLLDELANVIPKGVILTQVARQRNNILIKGEAKYNAQITMFMKNLSDSKWLTNVSLSEIAMIRDETGTKKSFQLKLLQVSIEQEEKPKPRSTKRGV